MGIKLPYYTRYGKTTWKMESIVQGEISPELNRLKGLGFEIELSELDNLIAKLI